MYKTNHSAVFDGTAENFYEFAMAHGIEEESVRPPRIRALSFHLIPTSFFRKLKETPPTVPNSYRALACLAALPTAICLV